MSSGQPPPVSSVTSGLFSHTQAELIFQRVIDTIEKHERDIQSIQQNQQTSSTLEGRQHETLVQRIQSLEDRMEDLSKRVDVIESSIRMDTSSSSSASTSTSNNNTMTVGEGVLANRRTLIRTLNLISTKADSNELLQLAATQNEHLNKVSEKLQHDLASNTSIEKINEAMNALQSRIDIICDDVRNKVDKSFMKTLSSEVNSIRHYANFVQETEKTLVKLNKGLDEVMNGIVEQKETSSTLMTRTKELEVDIKKRPSPEELRNWKIRLDSINSTLNDKADKNVVMELSGQSKGSTTRIHTCEEDTKTLFAAHETLAKHLTKRLDNVYTKTQLDTKHEETLVGVEQFMTFVEKTSSGLDEKACKTSLNGIQKLLEDLKAELVFTTKKADLAAQFIEWYGSSSNSSINGGRASRR